ncbi:MAG TPA: hypothetical protein VF177_12585, partial [Anaerolineae bacterium]
GDVGIPVAPEFETFYEAYGGHRVFGKPVTDAFAPEENGRLVQYFQTMRLEYDDDTESIVVYPLGQWAREGLGEKVELEDETAEAEFQAFYDEHNGEQLFGERIPPLLREDDLLVQYFRNARLEWHPELPPDQRVQVGLLGQAHFDAEMIFTYRKMLLAQPVPLAGISQVDVFAFVEAPILYAGEEQVLYVTVLTPAGRPVDGITVAVQIMAEGTEANQDVQVIGETDERGKTVTTLDLEDIPPGQQVQLLVLTYASNDNAIGRTRLTFKTWW